MGRKISKVAFILVVAGLAGLAGWRIYQVIQGQAQGNAPKKGLAGGSRIISVEAVESRLGSVREHLTLTGALKPEEQVDVTTKVPGRLEKIYFKIGDLIKEGALIAEIEDDEILQQVHRATAAIEVSRASRDQREAQLKNARAELERSASLVEGNLISRQDYESRTTSLEVARAQLSLAEAQIQEAEAELRELNIRLEQTKIYAPITGAVAIRYVDVGALITSSSPIMRIVNVSVLKTQANISERDLGKLRLGNAATVTVDALKDKVFHGRVSRIAPVLDASTRTVVAEIDVPNPDGLLRAEMFARIQLDSGLSREAVLIPREALVYRGQQPGVWVIESGVPEIRAVETGMTHGEEVEVLANLEPGTKIVGHGAAMLTSGDKIRIANQSPPSDQAEMSSGSEGGKAAPRKRAKAKE